MSHQPNDVIYLDFNQKMAKSMADTIKTSGRKLLNKWKLNLKPEMENIINQMSNSELINQNLINLEKTKPVTSLYYIIWPLAAPESSIRIPDIGQFLAPLSLNIDSI